VDFEGEPASSFNERRLKYCPLRDVAGMIRSFHYAAYGSLFLNTQIQSENIKILLPFIELWFHYICGFFIKSYLETVNDASFIPNTNEDIQILLKTFLLQKAICELNYELNYRLDWIIVPLRSIKSIIDKNRLAKIS
jgi:maltose alpha-D-glucosyltransferase/alpha-amylase